MYTDLHVIRVLLDHCNPDLMTYVVTVQFHPAVTHTISCLTKPIVAVWLRCFLAVGIGD
jgi:hypothetical protein